MKQYVLMHIGFERPTPEIMTAWKAWFAQAAPRTIQNIGLRNGREIGPAGMRDLPMDRDAITGCTIVSAENLEEAEKLAASNPFITGIRVYEMT